MSASAPSLPDVSTVRPRQARIAIVDDHELLRFGIAKLLEQESLGEVCALADDEVTGFQRIQETQPDLAIIDLRLHRSDGLELIRRVHHNWPGLRVLAYSALDETLFAERSLRAGARGYVQKDEPVSVFFTAVQTVLSDRIHLSPAMTELLLNRASGKCGAGGSPLAQLSDREMETFELLGQGLTVKQIACRLHLSPKTVEYHRDHIKEKLRLTSSTAVLRAATAWVLDRSPHLQ